MTRKKRLIDGDILNGHNPLPALQVEHAVDQQERKSMRQNLADVVDVEGRLGWRGRLGCALSDVSHSFVIKSDDYTGIRAIQTSEEKDFMPKRATAKKVPPKKAAKKAVPSQPSSAKPHSNDLSSHLSYFEAKKDEMVQTIRQLVEIESPTQDKQAVDRLGAMLAGRFEKLGGHSMFHRVKDFGDHLQVDFTGKRGGKPVLLLGHLDTVYPAGTLRNMPCRIADGKLYGPGAFDMKSGIAFMLHAIEALRGWHEDKLPRPVTVLLVSDEEVGSDSSRHITESVAKRCEAVLVIEPAFGPKGAVKTARKGVAEYTIKVTGKASHSGLDFEKGESAIVELARQVLEIQKFTDLKRGLTVNVGTILGGTRTNVIPAEAWAMVDVRIVNLKEAKEIDRKLHALKPVNRKCKLEITGGLNRPPMERTSSAGLYQRATAIAKDLGWKLEEAAVGGGSDGNFTAGLGIPTLDGLGGVGQDAHAPDESIAISELPRRAALLAELIVAL
jgi:glutamate carboxypeptidase